MSRVLLELPIPIGDMYLTLLRHANTFSPCPQLYNVIFS